MITDEVKANYESLRVSRGWSHADLADYLGGLSAGADLAAWARSLVKPSEPLKATAKAAKATR